MLIKIDDEIGYWGISARDIKRQLRDASGDIDVEINSPGGSVFEGISIYNALKDYDKGQVNVIIKGYAASMASYIAQAGDTVKATDNSVYMIHNTRVFTGGDQNQLRKMADVIEGLSNILKTTYVAKTGKSDEDIQSLMNDESYFFGQEMLDNGFVDEIISTNIEKDGANAMAFAKEAFKACITSVEAHAKDEDKEEIAAILKGFEANSNYNKPDKKSGVNPASAKIEKNLRGDSMEYTKESFKALEDTHAEALVTNTADVQAAERKRVSDILALNGNNDVKKKAIDDGITAGDCAIALNATNQEAIVAEKKDFEESTKDIQALETENTSDDEMSEDDKAIAADDAAYYAKKDK